MLRCGVSSDVVPYFVVLCCAVICCSVVRVSRAVLCYAVLFCVLRCAVLCLSDAFSSLSESWDFEYR